MNMYYNSFLSSGTQNVIVCSDILADADTIVNIIVNIVVIAGGVLAINYIRRQREKQVDSTFSYLMRLNVRLKFFHDILLSYKNEIMDLFLPKDYRREISADRIRLVADKISYLSKNATETLKFLKDSDNQMPAQKGWTKNLNQFIEFLIDCEQLDQTAYFKWEQRENLEEKKEQYYTDALINIEELLKMVYERQAELEEKIFKKER